MKIETWQQLAWRYRFNDEVDVDVENRLCRYNDNQYNRLPDLVRVLSQEVLCKACRILKIDKGNGTFRYAYAPNDLYKQMLRDRLPRLEYLLDMADPRGMFHAFRKDYNAVTNAKAHIGYDYSAKFDLKDFFGSIPFDLVKDVVPEDMHKLCLIEGGPKQGLPTSPIIASLALQKTAYKLQDDLKQILGKKYQMTVYADDLTISFNDRMKFTEIKDMVYAAIKAAGLKVNYDKTKLKFGHVNNHRRIICGVAVGKTKIYRTRHTKMAINKALHHKDTAKALGLMEWAKCKEPRSRR